MFHHLSNWLDRAANTKTVTLWVGLYILFGFVIMPGLGRLTGGHADGPGPIDLMFAYKPAEVFARIAAYGADGRIAYAISSLTVDVIYPVTYTLAFSLLITVLARRVLSAGHGLRRLNVLPFCIFFFDMLENASLVTLLMSYPTQWNELAWAASSFTTIKWSLAGLTILWAIGLFFAMVTKFAWRRH
jgi:hypothetical protein